MPVPEYGPGVRCHMEKRNRRKEEKMRIGDVVKMGKRLLCTALVLCLMPLWAVGEAPGGVEEDVEALLKENCYVNPQGGTRLHLDPYCKSVSEKYLPLTRVAYTEETKALYKLCPLCCHAEESGETGVSETEMTMSPEEEARAIVRDRFTEDAGIVSEYEERIETYGPFRFWTPEQKYRYSRMLPILAEGEKQRMEKWHSDWLLSIPFEYRIAQWRYGLPDENMIQEDDARARAKELLRDRYGFTDGTEGLLESVAFYTGHWACDSFPSPYWVFAWYDHARKKAEVWLNAVTGNSPEHEAMEVAALGKEDFLKMIREDLEAGDTTLTEDVLEEDILTILFIEEENLWHLIFSPMDDMFWEFAYDDDTLTLVMQEVTSG